MQVAAGAATGVAMTNTSGAADPAEPPSAKHLPRWHGFNLQEKFGYGPNVPFVETDFAWMAEWGFDFVRFPMSYKCWTEEGDWLKFREEPLKEIDQGLELGRKHKIHVCMNFHRAPGYCVGDPKEPLDLWKDEEAQKVCAIHWGRFAKRYQGVPNTELSFDLVNEPAMLAQDTYVRVATRLVEAIRAEDPNRLIIADGTMWGRIPVPGLAALGIAQSTRGYDPHTLTHYKASWAPGSDKWAEPTWPLKLSEDKCWDKERLRKECIERWKQLEEKGVGVHVGEWGAYQYTPHKVVLAWMRDFLDLWKEAGWGWALWNFRGSFGFLDSNREDVTYEDFRGHKLDRAMLDLVRSYL